MRELPELGDRNLHSKTPLVNRGRPAACVVTPNTDEMLTIGGMVASFLSYNVGVELPTVTASEYAESPRLRRHHVIALGDLTTNPILADLYMDGRHCVDLHFPGRGGYVIKSIHNPLGARRNYFVLGGSDPDGVQSAADGLCEVLSALEDRMSLPPTLCCVPGKHTPPSSDLERLEERAAHLLDLRGAGEVDELIEDGLLKPLHHFDVYGDFRWTFLARLALEIVWGNGGAERVAQGMQRPERWLSRLVVTWDNVEEFPAFSPEDRHRMAVLLGAAALRLRERWGSLLSRGSEPTPLSRAPVQAALALFEAGRYFASYYDFPAAQQWSDVARAYFALPRPDVHTADLAVSEVCASLTDLLLFAFRSRIAAASPQVLQRLFVELGAFLDNSGLPAAGDLPPEEFGRIAALANMLAWASPDLPFSRPSRALRDVLSSPAVLPIPGAFFSDRRRRWPPRAPGTMVFWLDAVTPGWLAALREAEARREEGAESALAEGPIVPLPPLAASVPHPFRAAALRSGNREDDDYLLVSGVGDPSQGQYSAGAVLRLQLAGQRVMDVSQASVEALRKGSRPSSILGIGIRWGQGRWVLPAFASISGILGRGTLWGAVMDFPVEDPGLWRRAILQMPREAFAIVDLFRPPRDGEWELTASYGTSMAVQKTDRGVRLPAGEDEFVARVIATHPTRTEVRRRNGDSGAPSSEGEDHCVAVTLVQELRAQEALGSMIVWGRAGTGGRLPGESGMRMLGPDLLALETSVGQRHMVWLGASPASLGGDTPLQAWGREGDFTALVLNEYLSFLGVRRLALPHASLVSDHPVSLTFDPSERTCVVSSQWPASILVGARRRRSAVTLEAGRSEIIDFPVPVSEYEELRSWFEEKMQRRL